jgi:hypothetical protein
MTAARRLAAILAVDVVGYSRLMGEDEAGTARAVPRGRDSPPDRCDSPTDNVQRRVPRNCDVPTAIRDDGSTLDRANRERREKRR